jgi:23S rRNA (pseudouridine1915-N3)-methyltransferase
VHSYLIAVGERPPSWIAAGFEEYCARLPREWRLQLIEVAPAKRSKNSLTERRLHEEGQRLLAALPSAAHAIALTPQGQQWDTAQLAQRVARWLQEGRDLAFIIGGPDGLHGAVLGRCETHWSLSQLTFPHTLVRILVVEQLYRAWSILSKHPYHRL